MKLNAVMVVGVLLVGCEARGVPTTMPSAVVASAQCVWHLLAPDDTADSDEAAGVSNCDGERLQLRDGVVDLAVTRAGDVTVGDCTARGELVDHDAHAWFVDVDGCGVRGLVGVNLR